MNGMPNKATEVPTFTLLIYAPVILVQNPFVLQRVQTTEWVDGLDG